MEARGPEGRSPEGRGPEGRGPQGRGPEGHAPEVRTTPAALHSRDPVAPHPGAVLHETRDLRPPARDIGHERSVLAAHAHDFHDRDVHHFNEREFPHWRDGRWGRDWHYGRYGWWYEVDGVEYPYDDPAYPYPVEVSEPVVAEIDPAAIAMVGAEVPAGTVTTGVVADGTVAGGAVMDGGAPVPAPVAASVPAQLALAGVSSDGPHYVIVPLPAAPLVTYRCSSPQANYPSIHVCTTTWTEIPVAQ